MTIAIITLADRTSQDIDGNPAIDWTDRQVADTEGDPAAIWASSPGTFL